MRPLVPSFILDNFARQQVAGQFSAVSLFVDTSGFTQITGALEHHGEASAEVLAEVLQSIFEPLTHCVYRYGGFVANFSGDGFTALFPGHDPPMYRQAVAAGWEIRQHMRANPTYPTRYGAFDFSVTVSLAAGPVAWAILPAHLPDDVWLPRSFVFHGPAIDQAIQAESAIGNNQVGLSAAVYRRVQPQVQSTPGGPPHTLATIAPDAVPQPVAPPPDSPYQAAFFSPALHHLPHTGEFRRVAILFINLRVETDDDPLPDFLAAALPRLVAYGGHLARIARIGGQDAGYTLLLFWGAPTGHENNAARALQFLLDVQAETEAADFRAGLTEGVVWAGFVGSRLRQEYTCYGLSINLAARQMTAAGWGEIWLDEAVARQARTPARVGEMAFAVKNLGRRTFKGFAAPLPVFQLLGRQPPGERVFAETMVGREAELARLTDFAQPLFWRRQAGVALLAGEAGIGKSRLAFALRQTLGAQVSWFTGQTDSLLRQSFSPFVYWLRRYFNQSPEADAAENRRRFESRLAELRRALAHDEAAGSLPAELTRTASFLGAMLNLHWPDSLYAQVDATLRHENTLAAIKSLLLAECHRRPVVLKVEDAHWLDSDSQELLAALTRNIDTVPLLLLITTRPQRDGRLPEFTLPPDVPRLDITLEPLSPSMLRWQAELILGDGIDENLYQTLLAKTQANPLFAQQFLYYFRDNERLRRGGDGRWQLFGAGDPIPGSLTAILVARIDRLTQQVKQVVQTAAVLGREFDAALLGRMLPFDVRPLVMRAAQLQIWTPLSGQRFIFNHILMREAAYEMQLTARRQRLHQLAGQAYETLYAADLAPHYAELAYHYGRAQDKANSLRYARLAGRQAIDASAYPEAVHYLSQALALAEAPAARLELLGWREQAYDMQGQREAQQADLDGLAALAEAADNQEAAAQAALRQANYHLAVGDYPAGLAAVQQAIGQAGNRLVLLAAGYMKWGKILQHQGDYGAARQRLETALQHIQQASAAKGDSGDDSRRRLVADCLRSLGTVAWSQGDFANAHIYYSQALTIGRDIGDRFMEGRCLNSLGVVSHDEWAFAAAQDYYAQALAISRDIGDRNGEGIALSNLGLIGIYLGNYSEAEAHSRGALAISRETDDLYGQAVVLNNLGMVALYRQVYDQAYDFLRQALAISCDIGDQLGEGITLHLLGWLKLAQGEVEQAELYYGQALAIRQALKQPQYLVEDQAGLAAVAVARGEPAMARIALEPVLAYLADNPDLDGAEHPFRVLHICVQVLHAAADPQAGAVLAQARRLLRERAARLEPADRATFLHNIPEHRALLE